MLTTWASEGVFSRGTITGNFHRSPQTCLEGSESDEISFFLVETNKTTFFVKNVIENVKFQNPGEGHSHLSPSDASD